MNATLLAISVDSAEDSRALSERLSISFPLLSDPNREIIRAYGVDDQDSEIAVPSVFVVSASGEILWRYVGESMSDRPVLTQILEVLRR